jgi:hypothetical protein
VVGANRVLDDVAPGPAIGDIRSKPVGRAFGDDARPQACHADRRIGYNPLGRAGGVGPHRSTDLSRLSLLTNVERERFAMSTRLTGRLTFQRDDRSDSPDIEIGDGLGASPRR